MVFRRNSDFQIDLVSILSEPLHALTLYFKSSTFEKGGNIQMF